MYIPAHFRNENEAELIGFMQEYSFGLLLCNGPEFPLATHLPFTVEQQEHILLTSHFAAANPQAKNLRSGDKVSVVFSGPHAYISPSHYDAPENVPTWNYIAVHAHGTFHVATEAEKETVLRKMINTYEPAYEKQYDQLPEKYLNGLKNGIVAFTVRVEKLEGKYKLSQNKKENERNRITEHLSKENDALAAYMKKQ